MMENKCCGCPAEITPGIDLPGITQADQIARLAYLTQQTSDGLTTETNARIAADSSLASQITAGDAANKKLIDSVDAEVGQLQSEFGTLETNVSELGTKVQQQGSLIAANGVDIQSLGNRVGFFEDVTTLTLTKIASQKLVDGSWTTNTEFNPIINSCVRNGNFIDLRLTIMSAGSMLAATTFYRVGYNLPIPTSWLTFLPTGSAYFWSAPTILGKTISTGSIVDTAARYGWVEFSKPSATNSATITISFNPPAIGAAATSLPMLRILIPIVPPMSG